jgi:hypothetical protein
MRICSGRALAGALHQRDRAMIDFFLSHPDLDANLPLAIVHHATMLMIPFLSRLPADVGRRLQSW